MNTKFFILYFVSFSNILSIQILKKYSSIKVGCTDKSIAFDSRGFNINDEMFFTFSLSGKKLEKKIYYQFEDFVSEERTYQINSGNGKSKEPTSSYETKSGNKVTINHYYSINKLEDKHYTLIGFYCEYGTLTIENTKEDGGKKANTIIIIVVVVCCVVVVGIIIFCCIRAKKTRAARAAMRMQMASGGYYPQPGMNMGMGMSVGIGMPPAYGSNYMMNNMPPQPGLISSQPVAYSRMPNDATQIEPNSPNELAQPSSGKRIIKSKV